MTSRRRGMRGSCWGAAFDAPYSHQVADGVDPASDVMPRTALGSVRARASGMRTCGASATTAKPRADFACSSAVGSRRGVEPSVDALFTRTSMRANRSCAAAARRRACAASTAPCQREDAAVRARRPGVGGPHGARCREPSAASEPRASAAEAPRPRDHGDGRRGTGEVLYMLHGGSVPPHAMKRPSITTRRGLSLRTGPALDQPAPRGRRHGFGAILHAQA